MHSPACTPKSGPNQNNTRIDEVARPHPQALGRSFREVTPQNGAEAVSKLIVETANECLHCSFLAGSRQSLPVLDGSIPHCRKCQPVKRFHKQDQPRVLRWQKPVQHATKRKDEVAQEEHGPQAQERPLAACGDVEPLEDRDLKPTHDSHSHADEHVWSAVKVLKQVDEQKGLNQGHADPVDQQVCQQPDDLESQEGAAFRTVTAGSAMQPLAQGAAGLLVGGRQINAHEAHVDHSKEAVPTEHDHDAKDVNQLADNEGQRCGRQSRPQPLISVGLPRPMLAKHSIAKGVNDARPCRRSEPRTHNDKEAN
mmetsp:Transcript_51270/g.158876  ORF Transcript_51270/g.158876 Transcript_51270/m.158876 type:complete len:310 (-) Transcript_51270:420-1349(-)